MTAPDALTMAEAAGRCGLSSERFRKVWPAWVRDLGFPGPFRQPRVATVGGARRVVGGPRYAWRASAIDDWKALREAAAGVFEVPANLNTPHSNTAAKAVPARLVRERAELRRLMRSA